MCLVGNLLIMALFPFLLIREQYISPVNQGVYEHQAADKRPPLVLDAFSVRNYHEVEDNDACPCAGLGEIGHHEDRRLQLFRRVHEEMEQVAEHDEDDEH